MKPDGEYIPVTSIKELEELCLRLNKAEEIAIDTETSGVNPLSCSLYGISITDSTNYGWYIPTQQELKDYDQLSLFDQPDKYVPLEIIIKLLKPVFTNPNIVKYMHNAKFDLHVLNRHGCPVEQPIFDTMVAAWVLGNVYGAKYGLKPLAELKLGYRMTTYKEVAGRLPFYKVPLERATDYAAADVDMTLRLSRPIKDAMEKFPSLVNTMQLEQKMVPVLTRMEANGVLIDSPYLEDIKITLADSIRKAKKLAYSELRSNINIDSQPQLLSLLNQRLQKSGKIISSTDEAALTSILDEDKAAVRILQYRKLYKMYSTYVVGILSKVDDFGRLHTDYQQHGIKTGRISSSEPNMQNLPTRKEDKPDWFPELPSIRRAIIVPDGWKFVSIDYSQLELRLATHISRDPTWIQAFLADQDIHAATAAKIYGVPIEQVSKDQRKRAKTVNFAILYGTSAYGLAPRVKMSVKDTEDFIEEYFENLPGIRKYIEDRRHEVLTRKYVETPYGRRLYFKFDPTDRKGASAAQREGTNMPIQGYAADIVKLSMIQIHDLLLQNRYRTRMLLQVHDEIDFEMPEEEMSIVIPQVVEIMRNAQKLLIPLKVDVEVGDNWEDIYDWKN